MSADLIDQTGLLQRLQGDLEHIDMEIIRLVQRRTELSKLLGTARQAAGGTYFTHEQELAMVRRYGTLGLAGRELAQILLRQTRPTAS